MKIDKIKKGDIIYFNDGSMYVYPIRFLKWCKMRRGDGGENTNKMGIGAEVESDWLFCKTLQHKIPHGLKRGQSRMRPYIPLYKSYEDAINQRNAIVRPKEIK